jgi:hypothetical protein
MPRPNFIWTKHYPFCHRPSGLFRHGIGIHLVIGNQHGHDDWAHDGTDDCRQHVMGHLNDPPIVHRSPPDVRRRIVRVMRLSKTWAGRTNPPIAIVKQMRIEICLLVDSFRFRFCSLPSSREVVFSGVLTRAGQPVASYGTWETRTHTDAKSKSRRNRSRNQPSSRRPHACRKRRQRLTRASSRSKALRSIPRSILLPPLCPSAISKGCAIAENRD